jgi:Myb-like DNA-binding domain
MKSGAKKSNTDKSQDTFTRTTGLAFLPNGLLLPVVKDLFGSFNMDGTYLTKDGTYDMIQDESKQKKSTDEGCIVTDLCVSSPKETLQKNLQGKRAGRWSPEEKLLFLHGLKQFGRGRWKKIQTFLPTR